MEFTFGIAIGAIIASIITVSYNIYSSKQKRKIEQKEKVNYLLGELLNVICHYEFFEIPTNLVDGPDANHKEVMRKMELCKYGTFKASENVQNYGFLNATQVRNIHQLSLRIRNTDLLIDRYLKNEDSDVDSFSLGSIKDGLY